MLLFIFVKFIWDAQNAAEHLSKHGVSFDEAATAYNDPSVYFEPNLRHPERTNFIGYSEHGRLLYVVTVEILDDQFAEIITAWKATPAQKRRYENQ